jgi:hypothetical protein
VKKCKTPKENGSATMTADEMIKILSEAGYVVSKPVLGSTSPFIGNERTSEFEKYLMSQSIKHIPSRLEMV